MYPDLLAEGQRDPADRELLLDALGALVFWRLIALNEPVSAAHLDRIADAVVVPVVGQPPGIR